MINLYYWSQFLNPKDYVIKIDKAICSLIEDSSTKEENMHFNNLDDVAKYVQEHMEGWTIRRGKQTFMSKNDHTPADDYEVIQLFRPGNHTVPFAEFWRGYYDFSPNSYKGCYGLNLFGCSCSGDLDFAMRAVKEEHDRLYMCPRIIKAVQTAAEKDDTLKGVYRSISEKDIRPMRGNDGIYYAVECDHFLCEKNQRCVMSVKERENVFNVKYSLQTWRNGYYETDTSNTIAV